MAVDAPANNAILPHSNDTAATLARIREKKERCNFIESLSDVNLLEW